MSEIKKLNGSTKYPAEMKISAPAIFVLPAYSCFEAAAKRGFYSGSGSAELET